MLKHGWAEWDLPTAGYITLDMPFSAQAFFSIMCAFPAGDAQIQFGRPAGRLLIKM
jgi:hypothetical protein